MCGICGSFAYGWSAGEDRSVIERMRDAMSHRGHLTYYDTIPRSLLNLSRWYDGWIAAERERALAAA